MPALVPALRRAASRARRQDLGAWPKADEVLRRGIVLAPADPSEWSHSHRLVDSLEPRDRRQLGLALLSDPHGTRDICLEAALTRHTCGWSPEETEELLALALLEFDHKPYTSYRVCRSLGLPLAAVREQEPARRARFGPQLRSIVLRARTHHLSSRPGGCQWHLSVDEAADLLDSPRDREVLRRIAQVLPDQDVHRNRALAALGTLVFEPGVPDLLETLTAIDSFRPAQPWLGRVHERLEMLPAAPEVLGTLLRMDTSYPEHLTEAALRRQKRVADEANLMAAAAWAACLTGNPDLIALVAAQALRRSRERRDPGLLDRHILPVRAAVTALNAAAGVPGLGRHRRALSGLSAEAAAAARAALDAIADEFLSDDGARRVPLMGHTAYLVIRPQGSVGVEIRTDLGQEVRPYAMRQFNEIYVLELAALRHRMPLLTAHVDRERGALAELLATGTALTGERFCARWLDHNVAGPLCQALVWEAQTAVGTFIGLPTGGPYGRWQLRVLLDGTYELRPTDTVRLWNPLHVDRAQRRAWRTHLERSGLRQPIRQFPARPK